MTTGNIHGIPEEQYDLPVLRAKGGKWRTLREIASNGNFGELSLHRYTRKEKIDIATERVRRQPEMQIAILGYGTINKKTALHEMQIQTEIGRELVELEMEAIQLAQEILAKREILR